MQVIRKKAASLLQRLRTSNNSMLEKATDITDESSVSLAATCPTEVLLNIFSYLNTEHLAKCREVCRRWRSLVEDNELFWRRRCELDFVDNYKAAYHKREKGLSWFGLYRSLSLWSKIRFATVEMQYTFNRPASLPECGSIYGFQLLSRGEVGIHYQWEGIVYYDIETLQESQRENIPGHFIDYVENDDVITLLTCNESYYTPSDLYVIRKVIRPGQEEKYCITSVRSFFLTVDVLYYVKSRNEEHIYTCNLSDVKLESSLLLQIPGGVVIMGYKNGFLYVLMKKPYEIGIFNVDGTSPVRVDLQPNLIDLLCENEHLQVRLSSLGCWSWNDLKTPRPDVEIIKIYGDIIFIGLYIEIFLIFYVPHLGNRLDIFHTDCKPVLQYNFKGGGEFTHIDVMERNDGHTVLVGMRREIVVLKFNHEFTGNKTEL